MDTARVVEVLHDRGPQNIPRWLLGSGFIIRAGVVLTAAHNLGEGPSEVGPEGTIVRPLDGRELPATSTLVRDEELDLAVLIVPGAEAPPVQFARVDRSRIDVIANVTAVGFPNYKYAPDKPVAQRRQPAQPQGIVPTAENFSDGHLVLKIDAGAPPPGNPGDDSPWAGLSGAAVFHGETLLGVAIEHHAKEGQETLHFWPFSALLELPVDRHVLIASALGIPDVATLPVVNSPIAVVDETLRAMLEEIVAFEQIGLLGPSEAKSLRVTAFKKARGL